MAFKTRTFDDKPAVRESVPLLLGLMGPSGGGKTFSALRLATGIQKIAGGDIGFIDTEAKRALHYASQFKFRHLPFDPPFGALDYMAALEHFVDKGVRTIIVDSMSHEHEGPGGLLDTHEQELQRLVPDGNEGRRKAMGMVAWQKPKSARRQLINRILQLPANFIFCFRAKESSKPLRVNGRTEIVPQGFIPIAGDEFVFEMTTCALLLPGAKGVPSWSSEMPGEKMMIKTAAQFEWLYEQGRALDEATGEALAKWAKGETPAAAAAGVLSTLPDSEVDDLVETGKGRAEGGLAALKDWLSSLTPEEKSAVIGRRAGLQDIAKRADEVRTTEGAL